MQVRPARWSHELQNGTYPSLGHMEKPGSVEGSGLEPGNLSDKSSELAVALPWQSLKQPSNPGSDPA